MEEEVFRRQCKVTIPMAHHCGEKLTFGRGKGFEEVISLKHSMYTSNAKWMPNTVGH